MSQTLRDVLVLLLVGLLVLSGWQLSRLALFRAGGDTSYWLAVVGSVMMLLVFLYPLRKHVRPLHRWGRVKWWLWLHIACGLFGPWLILIHSTFRIGSLNAGVALSCMVIVVLSGVIGRFLYVRVHRGLDGESTTLRELQIRAGFVETDARSRLHFAPEVQAELQAFEQRELTADSGWWTHLRRVTTLPLLQWIVEWRCRTLLDRALRVQAQAGAWAGDELQRRRRRAQLLVRRYLGAVVRVAQFSAYERVFGLWHVAHLPFVYLLVFSAVVHIVAVHAY